MKNYIGIDQYNQIYHDLGKHPRKKLLEQLSGKVSKMYVNNTKGDTFFTGYVIGSNWVNLYEIKPVRTLQK